LEPSDNLKFGILEFSNGTSQRDLKLLDHSFSLLATVNMEADCKDSTTMATKSKNITDMNALFEALSAKLTSETTKISQDFQSVAEAHNNFKQEVRNNIDELRNMILNSSHSSCQPDASSSVVPEPPSLQHSASTTTAANSQVPLVMSADFMSAQDIQSKMMMMMTESFTKLSTAFTEGKHENKSEWPKFSGDAKKFRSWYRGIMTQLSLPPWVELYDSTRHDIVVFTSNSVLW